jgi:hypothetical protein
VKISFPALVTVSGNVQAAGANLANAA